MVTIEEIDAFLIRNNIKPTVFGAACGDGKLVSRMRCGGGITAVTDQKIRAAFLNLRKNSSPPSKPKSMPTEDDIYRRSMESSNEAFVAAIKRENPHIFAS